MHLKYQIHFYSLFKYCLQFLILLHFKNAHQQKSTILSRWILPYSFFRLNVAHQFSEIYQIYNPCDYELELLFWYGHLNWQHLGHSSCTTHVTYLSIVKMFGSLSEKSFPLHFVMTLYERVVSDYILPSNIIYYNCPNPISGIHISSLCI